MVSAFIGLGFLVNQMPKIDEGKSKVVITINEIGLDVFVYKPKNYRGDRMIIVFHGTLRNAEDYRDHSMEMGDRFGALIIAPKFDSERFPTWRYQRGGLLDAEGKLASPEAWTYAFIPKIAEAIKQREDQRAMKYWLIGHSAGGQFLVRAAAFQDTGAERIVAANAGSQLFAHREAPFGYGFGNLPESLSSDDQIRQYLAAPLTLFVGTADNKPDEYFDDSEEAMKQGGGRFQRNKASFEFGQKLAKEKGWKFNWRIVEALEVEHDHEKMFNHPACEHAFFGD
jgi:poly(3-hydroxybutyrate) depolymerase